MENGVEDEIKNGVEDELKNGVEAPITRRNCGPPWWRENDVVVR
jgi:hypothetical protein